MMKHKKRIKAKGSIRHLATRIFNVPLLIEPRKLDAILAVLGPRLGLAAELIPARVDDFEDFQEPNNATEIGDENDAEPDPNEGICVIPIYGTLVKRATGMDALSGLTSYESIRAELQMALDDETCTAIVLDIDSPGGEASGMFDLANFITGIRGQKPLIGIANDSAYSAAYCLASCCDRLLVTSVGGVGSVGCYMLHCDESGYDKQNGLKYTYIYSGAKKVDGNPHEPLSTEALVELQAEADRIRQMFVQTVARNRAVDAQAIYDTEAGCLMGAQAVPLLADQVGTLEDACALALSMTSEARSPAVASGGTSMKVWYQATIELPPFQAGEAGKWYSYIETLPRKASFDRGNVILAVRRFGTAKLSTMASETGHSVERVSGILAPYNSLSCDLGGFQEIYQPGCFSECIKSADDFRVLFNHNPDHVLGRRSAGTARFWEEADGLHYEADLPDTQAARDLKTSMERGDIRESSAAFYILQHRWEQRSTGRVRIIEKAKLVEGSPASFAAYEHSTAAVAEPAQQEMPAAAEAPIVGPNHELEQLEARLQLLRA